MIANPDPTRLTPLHPIARLLNPRHNAAPGPLHPGDAPRAWPTVNPARPAPGTAPNARAADALTAAVHRALAAAGVPIVDTYSSRLTAHGVLDVPLTVRDRHAEIDVFIYPHADPAAARRHAAIRELYEQLGLERPAYYAPAALAVAGAAAPDEAVATPLRARHLEPLDGELPHGLYATWWPTPGDEHFLASAARAHLARAAEAVNGFESRVYAILARRAGLLEDQPELRRVALPATNTLTSLQGPERTPILLTAWRDKGLRFHFHMRLTAPHYRDHFLRQFADYCENLRDEFERACKGQDDPSVRPVRYWRARLAMGASGQPFGAVRIPPERP